MSEPQEQEEAEIVAAISSLNNASEQDQENVSPDKLLSEPLDEGISGDTQTEWQDINSVLLSELQSEPIDKTPEKELDSDPKPIDAEGG